MFHGEKRTATLGSFLCRTEKHGQDETVPVVDLGVTLALGVEELEEIAPGVSGLQSSLTLADLPDVGPFDVEISGIGLDDDLVERGVMLRSKVKAEVVYHAPRRPFAKVAPEPPAEDPQPGLPGVAPHGSEEWLTEQIAKDFEGEPVPVEHARNLAAELYSQGHRDPIDMARIMSRGLICRSDPTGSAPSPESFVVIAAQQVLAKDAEKASAGRHECTITGKLALHVGQDFPYYELHDSVGQEIDITFHDHAEMRRELEALLLQNPITTFVTIEGGQAVIEDRQRVLIAACIKEREPGQDIEQAFWNYTGDLAKEEFKPSPAPAPYEPPAEGSDPADHPDDYEIVPGAWAEKARCIMAAERIYEEHPKLDARGVTIRVTKSITGKKGNVVIDPKFYAAVEAMIAGWGKDDSPFGEEPGEPADEAVEA